MPHFDRLAELERERASFAVATVVARRAPVSSHLGDRAIVHADGRIEGFVGGSCSRDIVRREALRALGSGLPRLVRIRPDGDLATPPSDDCVVVAMGCASEGAVDVYVEPHVPRTTLLIAGDTPVADALARIAAQSAYDVVRVVLGAELANAQGTPGVRAVALERLAQHLDDAGGDARAQLVAVVASQGHYDEAALAPILTAEPAFVGLLASPRRGAAVKAALAADGVPHERLDAIRVPVGLDIGARTPGDVAISILAEIVASQPPPRTARALALPDIAAFDPVCGMEVDIDAATPQLRLGERTYFFCCAGCRASFAAEHATA